MPSFLLSKLKQAQPSMRRRLFLYMGALAVLLLAALFVALLLLGQLKSPRAETEKALTFQMGAFRSDMSSLWRNVSVMGVHLSEDISMWFITIPQKLLSEASHIFHCYRII